MNSKHFFDFQADVFARAAVFSIVIVFLAACIYNSPAHAQRVIEGTVVAGNGETAEVPNWRVERSALDREFADKLEEIASWCRENGIEQQIEETFKVYQSRDLGRQFIFLPSSKTMPQPPEGIHGQWLTKINEVKKWQAERVFELAKRACKAKDGSAAFQLLNEVLYFDRDHAEVRKILSHRKTDEGWRVAPDRIKSRVATRNHDLLRWRKGDYLLVTSPHFEIESNVNEERTIYLAEKLERWQSAWRQVFFDYWSSPAALQRWIDGKSSYRHSKKKFRIIFFDSKEAYIENLKEWNRGIALSSGFYSPDQRVSFFYDDSNKAIEDNWRHELTHQLFRESISSGKAPFEKQFIWLDEGIATYFESFSDFGSYATLGGFESRRLQYSRVRMLLENYHIPIEELTALGRTDLQNRDDMARLYSEAAGLTDMLMNDESGAIEPRLTEFLKLMYSGRRIKPGVFEKIIGYSNQELDERYKDYLKVDPALFAQHLALPQTRTEMSVSGANLDDDGFAALGRCHKLNWIDLSRNRITPGRMGRLQRCENLSQLFLTECQIEPGSLRALMQFKNLSELDLSNSSVTDMRLGELVGVDGITSLRLTATAITDAGLPALSRLPNLKTLDVARSPGITNAGIQRLKIAMPNLQVTK